MANLSSGLIAKYFDTTPTSGSERGLTSGGAKTYIDSKISTTITDGVTDKAPNENAVFDALVLKVNASSGVFANNFSITGGATSNYLRGDGSTAAFASSVGSSAIGADPGTATILTTATTYRNAAWQLQNQISAITALSIVNTTMNTSQTAATLNAAYPTAAVNTRVLAPNVGTGMVYHKTTAGGQWLAVTAATLNP